MQPWQIVLWILVIVLLLYLLGFVYLLINLLNFRSSLQKKLVALSVLFALKKDVLLSLYALYDKASVPLDDADHDAAAKVRWLKTDVVSDDDVALITGTLNTLQKRLSFLSESQTYLKTGKDFQDYVDTIADLDANYHRVVATYNTDLNGYDYWRKVIIYRFWWGLFGLKAKKRLS